MTDRNKLTARFRITAVVVLVGYPLSIGPVDGLMGRLGWPEPAWTAVRYFYAPVNWVVVHGPRPVRKAIVRWDKWWLHLLVRRGQGDHHLRRHLAQRDLPQISNGPATSNFGTTQKRNTERPAF